jgi:hypothetical protein
MSSRLAQESAHAVLDHLGQAADARRHDGHLARHRFERGEAEALLGRRQQEQIRDGQERHDLILLAERLDVAREPRSCTIRIARPARDPPRRISVSPHVLADPLENLHDGVDALDGPEVREMNDELVVLGRRAQPRAQLRQIAAAVLVALEKVRDDADLVFESNA